MNDIIYSGTEFSGVMEIGNFILDFFFKQSTRFSMWKINATIFL